MGGLIAIISHYCLLSEGIHVDVSWHLDFPMLQNDLTSLWDSNGVIYKSYKQKEKLIIFNVPEEYLWHI